VNREEIRRRELARVRARLIARLREVAGPAMTAQDAQVIFEQARAWASPRARELDDHLAENPDALTVPSPHCPASLVRVLRQMEAAGHGQAVTQPGCAVCGRTSGPLRRTTPAGRCCNWCADRDMRRPCARCGQDGRIAARREEGPICHRCYLTDPLVLEECGRCGHRRNPAARREDGMALCKSCAPRAERQCARCGNVRPVWARAADGPVCRDCHQPPARPCGACGKVRPIAVRAVAGQPDICAGCYRGTAGECSICGRLRHGHPYRKGAFRCDSCQPRSSRLCADCGKTSQVKVTGWPVGALCNSCHLRRRRNPRPCSRCGTTRVLAGRSPEGDDLCGPCSGAGSLDFACRRCGFPGDIHGDGCCTRCVAGDRVRDFLSGNDGTISPQLQPLADALARAERPSSVLLWLQHGPSARLLAGLAARHEDITHELLDGLPQDGNTHHIRETLVATSILPRRQENLARLELWLNSFAGALPPHQARVIRPFAEWQILRDARRRAARGRYTAGAATRDRGDIRVAAEFLSWLDASKLSLSTVTQEDLDLWLTTHPTRRRGAGPFIRWTAARRLTSKLLIRPEPRSLPSQFLGDQEHHEQLRRCLTDGTLPLEVRIAGALIRLYALPVTRITELTTDRFHQDEDNAYFTFDRNPVLLPPTLARLIAEQIATPGRISILPQPSGEGPRFLLPGRPPSRPRRASSLHALMKQHGLPTISARNTAMIEAVTSLPPIVVSDLFGISAGTAHRWAQYAQDSWADYLAACLETTTH
jgi:hypothetical protein